MKPDHEVLLEQCDTAYKKYLMTLNCCRQINVKYMVVTDLDVNGDMFMQSSQLVPVDA